MKEYLKKSAGKIGIALNDQKLLQFEIYYQMLIETNRTMNLTAITEMEDVVLKHFIDSIALVNYISLENRRVVDLGTGAGFPGIPLAILHPDTQFVLIDSLKKRLRFIESVLEKNNMKNVSIVHGRAEDLGQTAQYREKFDICVSRAVASLPVLLELCVPFVKVGGNFISYKSDSVKEELNCAKHALEVLHCDLEKQYEYYIPDRKFYRVLAIFLKKRKLEKMYPRQAGKIKKNSL